MADEAAHELLEISNMLNETLLEPAPSESTKKIAKNNSKLDSILAYRTTKVGRVVVCLRTC